MSKTIDIYDSSSENYAVNPTSKVWTKESGTHLVGYNDSKYRVEKFKFTTGSLDIDSIQINFGQNTAFYEGSYRATIYWLITDKDLSGFLPTDFASQGCPDAGTLTFNQTQGTAKTETVSVVLARNKTYYIYVYSKTSKYGVIGIANDGGEVILTYTESTITKCSPPTSFAVTQLYAAPTGKINLSWAGARGGTGNNIKSYTIYWKLDSKPNASDAGGRYKEVGSTDSSTEITLNYEDQDRGHKIYFGIIANGQAGATYDSDMYYGSSEGISTSINRKPSAPQASATPSTVYATGTDVTFSVTAGSDNDVGQSYSVVYSTSETADRVACSNNFTVRINTSITYYFYTWDGYEYSSSATAVPIALTSATPAITGFSGNITTYTALGGNGVSGNRSGYADLFNLTVNTNTPGILKAQVEMAASDGTSTPTYTASYSFPELTMSGTSVTPFYDINKAVNAITSFNESTRQNTNIAWRLKFNLDVNGTLSADTYYPSSNKFYSIPHAPALAGVYNQHSGSNIEGTNTNEVYRNVRMKFYNDTSVENISVSATYNNITSNPTFTSGIDADDSRYRYLNITLQDGIASGANISIVASLTNTYSSVTKKVSCSVRETLAPTMGTLTHGGDVIWPFTDTGSYQISTVWPFGNYTEINSTTLQAYNCSTNAIKFIHASDTSGSNEVVKDLTWSKGDTDTITANLEGLTAYDFGYEKWLGNRFESGVTYYVIENNNYKITTDSSPQADKQYFTFTEKTPHELGYTTYAGRKPYYCQFQITNLFGKTYTSPWLSRTFDFNELAQSCTINDVAGWATSNTGPWGDFTTGSDEDKSDAAQEGMYFKFNLSFGLLTEDSIAINLLLENNAGTNVVVSQTYPSGLSYAINRAPVSNSVELIYGPVGIISNNNIRKWSFEVVNTCGKALSNEIEMKALKQTAPNTVFESASIDQNYNVTYKFSQSDYGGAASASNYLYSADDVIKVELNKTSDTIELEPDSQGWNIKQVCIKSTTTVKGLIDSTKTYYSNYITLYQVTPTIAYRKNQLGINTTTIASDEIIKIVGLGNDNIVIEIPNSQQLIISANDGKLIWHSLSSSEIPDKIIDFANGRLIGFVLG